MYYGKSVKEHRNALTSQMKRERTPHEATWHEIADLSLAFRLRLNLTDYNYTDRRNSRIFNGTATRAIKTFQSGLMTAATDPTSNWVSMLTKDPDRAEFGPHKKWLDEMTQLCLQDIADSNIYQKLPRGYGNEACFGIFAMGLEEKFTGSTVHSRLYPHGSFWVSDDDYGNAAVFYREYRSTVRQLYMRLGERGTFSAHVQNLIDNGNWEEWVDVAQLIQPNDRAKPGSPLAKHKPFSSCWYEIGHSSKASDYGKDSDSDSIFESGFDRFPIMVGRWENEEGEIWPTEYPGSESLGDNKSLQVGEKRLAQLIEKLVNPHWIAASGMRGLLEKGMLPGETSYVDERNEGKSLRPAHLVDPSGIKPMRDHLMTAEQRVLESFHYPTFATFDAMPDKQRTATEILERKSEKLLKLVDMYSNLQIGVLRPLFDYVYSIRLRRNDYPTPPPDLQGHLLDYKFNGVLSQSQKMNRVQPIERVLAIIGEIVAKTKDTSVLDKFNVDQAVDEIATYLGVPASVINSDEVVAMVREQRAKAQKAEMMAQMVPALTKSAKDLSQATLEGDNALSRMVA